MYLLIFVLLFQAQGSKPGIDLTKPHTESVAKPEPGVHPVLKATRPRTTPTLSEDSELQIHAGMERELGSQSEAVGEMKARVSSLEEHREKVDRPDISDLQTTREHFYWIASALFFGGGLIWYFRKFLWTSSIPILRRELKINEPEHRRSPEE
jgi:hypothetical protein